jgi:hypothetical protein
MTTESILEQYRRVTRELANAGKPEPSLARILERESAKLGVKFVPAPAEKGGE